MVIGAKDATLSAHRPAIGSIDANHLLRGPFETVRDRYGERTGQSSSPSESCVGGEIMPHGHSFAWLRLFFCSDDLGRPVFVVQLDHTLIL